MDPVAGGIDLMDTPGILWPKLETGRRLFAWLLQVRSRKEVYDFYAVAGKLVRWLAENRPEALREALQTGPAAVRAGELLEAVGAARGYYLSGGVVDTIKSARTVLKEFREGRLGQYT